MVTEAYKATIFPNGLSGVTISDSTMVVNVKDDHDGTYTLPFVQGGGYVVLMRDGDEVTLPSAANTNGQTQSITIINMDGSDNFIVNPASGESIRYGNPASGTTSMKPLDASRGNYIRLNNITTANEFFTVDAAGSWDYVS